VARYNTDHRPRNRRAAARGARHRETIKQLMLTHTRECPLSKQLTGKDLQVSLRRRGINLALSTILWHVNRIRLEADIAALDAELKGCNPSNSSDTTTALP